MITVLMVKEDSTNVQYLVFLPDPQVKPTSVSSDKEQTWGRERAAFAPIMIDQHDGAQCPLFPPHRSNESSGGPRDRNTCRSRKGGGHILQQGQNS